jgi:asparagine synthase (glutamine-hydrolysing)
LPAGHFLTWSEGKIAIECYWDLSFASSQPTPGTAKDHVEEYRERLSEAVRLRLMADVPLGAFLSGGIDSAAITAMMHRHVGDGIRTFSVAFAERSANELEYARIVARAFKTEHHEVLLGEEEFWSLLPSMIWHEDEPIAHPSSVALYAVARLAAAHVKVVLTGEGSDETLAGYNRYRVGLANASLASIWRRMLPASGRRSVARAIGEPGGTGLKAKLSRTVLGRGETIEGFYFDNFAVFTRSMQRQLLGAGLRALIGDVDPYAAHLAYLQRSDAPTLLGRLLYTDTKTYLHELLMKQDQMSMAASIESRVPFLDHPLVEWVSKLPDKEKLRGMTTKRILRRAMTGILPEAILNRPKMGFPVPVGAWLRAERRTLLTEFVQSDRALSRGLFDRRYVEQLVSAHHAGENHATRLWMLLNVEIWHRIFIDGESHEDVARTLASVSAPRTQTA